MTVGFYTKTRCDELHIDHVVSLKDAWETGARHWSDQEKQIFANDKSNHVSACGKVNLSKGSSTPLIFRSRSQDGIGHDYQIESWCEYISIYVSVKHKYELHVTKQVIHEFSECDERGPALH
jgi:hypothetical protein